jgi:hypothetical protein
VFLSSACAQKQASPRGLRSVFGVAARDEISSRLALRPAPDVPGGHLGSVYAALQKMVSPIRVCLDFVKRGARSPAAQAAWQGAAAEAAVAWRVALALQGPSPAMRLQSQV